MCSLDGVKYAVVRKKLRVIGRHIFVYVTILGIKMDSAQATLE